MSSTHTCRLPSSASSFLARCRMSRATGTLALVATALCGAPLWAANLQPQLRPLVVAVAFDPVDETANSLQRCQALAEPLTAALGQPVKIANSRSLRDIASGIRSGAFDALWVPANLVAAALKDAKMETLGTDGRTQRIALVARSSVQGFEDLRGKTLYLPLEDSAAGYVAAGLLSDHSVRLADFRTIYTSGHYEIAKLSISQAITSVTAMPEADAKALAAADKGIRMLDVSPPIPGNGLVVRRDLPPEAKLKLARYFAGLTSVAALAPTSPGTYKYLTGLSHYTPETWQGVEKVDAAKVQALAREGVAVVDVRTKDEYASKHLPGAQWVPYEERSARAVGIDYASDLFDLSALPAGARKLILYCNGPECWKSFKASLRALSSKRFESVYWFRGGLPEWERSGNPVVR
jgi:ABC-type phosphate/phosphonate transport system substrate-binding protein/rhodanese-related sulfurtransferase